MNILKITYLLLFSGISSASINATTVFIYSPSMSKTVEIDVKGTTTGDLKRQIIVNNDTDLKELALQAITGFTDLSKSKEDKEALEKAKISAVHLVKIKTYPEGKAMSSNSVLQEDQTYTFIANSTMSSDAVKSINIFQEIVYPYLTSNDNDSKKLFTEIGANIMDVMALLLYHGGLDISNKHIQNVVKLFVTLSELIAKDASEKDLTNSIVKRLKLQGNPKNIEDIDKNMISSLLMLMQLSTNMRIQELYQPLASFLCKYLTDLRTGDAWKYLEDLAKRHKFENLNESFSLVLARNVMDRTPTIGPEDASKNEMYSNYGFYLYWRSAALTAVNLFGSKKYSNALPFKILALVSPKSVAMVNGDSITIDSGGNGTKLSDIKGFCEYYGDDCKNIKELSFIGHNFSDISELEKIVNINKLVIIDDNNLADISPVKKLIKLKKLNLSSNKNLVDISPLENLENLTEIELNYDAISDIGPLGKVKNLEVIGLGGNKKLSTIQPLKNMEKLKKVWLRFSGVDENDDMVKELRNRGVNVIF